MTTVPYPNLTSEERAIKRNYPEYVKWRKSIYEKNNYICQKCFGKGVYLNAHHIKNYSTNRELRTDKSNGITLCKKCHSLFHSIYGRKNNTMEQLSSYLSTPDVHF